MNSLKTSEFWMGLAAAILGFLVQQHIVSEDVAAYAKMALVYAVGRITSKVASGGTPFQPAIPKPIPPR